MTNLIFLLSSDDPEQGYTQQDAKKLNGLNFPSLEAFYRQYPDVENEHGEPKIIRLNEDDFAEEWNNSEFDTDMMNDRYVAVITIGGN